MQSIFRSWQLVRVYKYRNNSFVVQPRQAWISNSAQPAENAAIFEAETGLSEKVLLALQHYCYGLQSVVACNSKFIQYFFVEYIFRP